MGKLPAELLRKYVFSRTGAARADVLVGPREGVDVSLLLGDEDLVIVAHSDPIVGAVKRIGWLAVNIACNDIATSGVEPRWLLPIILLPEKWTEEMLDEITADIDSAARELGISVVGGHTGYAAGVSRPIVTATVIGVGKKDEVTISANAKAGDSIYLTKGAGIEGTAILATDFRDVLTAKGIGEDVIKKAEKFMNEISVVKEALALARASVVHAMHDATRGGVAEALIELAYASGKLIEVWEREIPLREETKIFSTALGFDPLWMISSGTLIFTTPEDKRDEAERILKKLGINYSRIGIVKTGKPEVILHRRTGIDEKITEMQPEKDELARLWELYPRIE